MPAGQNDFFPSDIIGRDVRRSLRAHMRSEILPIPRVSSRPPERVSRAPGVPLIVATGVRTPVPPAMSAPVPRGVLMPLLRFLLGVAVGLGAVALIAFFYYR